MVGILLIVTNFNSSKRLSTPHKKDRVEKIPQKKINPNGTHLLYKLLERYTNTTAIKRIQTSYNSNLENQIPIKSENGQPNIYISVGLNFSLKSEDNEYLLNFVSKGNYALIAYDQNTNNLLSDFFQYSKQYNYIETDTIVQLNYFHPDFKKDHPTNLTNPQLNYHQLPKYKKWFYFNPSILDESTIKIANINNAKAICIQINYGKGKFILHTIPDAFSNSFIAKKEGKEHSEIIFSHFPKGNYFWHENYGRYSTYRGKSNPEELQKPQEYSKSSPLQYILQEPALTAALVLSLIGVLLYILVKSKRKQQIIRPIAQNNNSSLEFIEVISKLYLKQKRHDKILVHIENNFKAFIKQRYFININEINTDLITKIHLKSGIEKKQIITIIKTLSQEKNKSISDNQLIIIYQQIEYFYANCI